MECVKYLCALLISFPPGVCALGCFRCQSFNNSDPTCGDPFHPARCLFDSDCMQGASGRLGKFPAQYCTKIRGQNRKTGIELTVRTCSLDSMEDQCGYFKMDGDIYKGCVTSCNTEACNGALTILYSSLNNLLCLKLLLAQSTFLILYI